MAFSSSGSSLTGWRDPLEEITPKRSFCLVYNFKASQSLQDHFFQKKNRVFSKFCFAIIQRPVFLVFVGGLF